MPSIQGSDALGWEDVGESTGDYLRFSGRPYFSKRAEARTTTASAATVSTVTPSLSSPKTKNNKQEKVELVAPPEGSAVGERLSLEGVAGGPFEPVSAAQMDKKKLLDKILPVRLLSVQPTQLRKGGVLFCAVSVLLRTFLLRGMDIIGFVHAVGTLSHQGRQPLECFTHTKS